MPRLVLVLLMLLPTLGGAQPLRVFVSVLPQTTFVEKVGGEHVAVYAMVGPGDSPTTYHPTPRQLSNLAKAALYVRIGVPFEESWMPRIRSANPNMRVVDARDGIRLRPMVEHEHGEGEHPHGEDPAEPHLEASEQDPHLWTSPLLVKQMARNIRDALAELDPAHALAYQRNYTAFAAELDALDQDIRSLLADLPNRRFMVFHPAWGYFADAYGLTQVAIEHEGKKPGARTLNRLVEQAKREGIKVIFVQPQFDRKSALQVARAIGGEVVAIDPLALDYAANLRKVAGAIAQAARR